MSLSLRLSEARTRKESIWWRLYYEDIRLCALNTKRNAATSKVKSTVVDNIKKK